MGKINSIIGMIAAAGLCAIATAEQAMAAAAPDWPTRPVRVVIPWAVGGGTDPLARVSTQSGDPVAVEQAVR